MKSLIFSMIFKRSYALLLILLLGKTQRGISFAYCPFVLPLKEETPARNRLVNSRSFPKEYLPLPSEKF